MTVRQHAVRHKTSAQHSLYATVYDQNPNSNPAKINNPFHTLSFKFSFPGAMSIIDSEAAFEDRCLKFGVTPLVIASFKTAKVCSYGSFAHITAFNPVGGPASDTGLKEAIEFITGAPPTPTELAYYRRLHFEANAMTVADTKLRTEASDESAPRRLPAPERTSRFNQQKTRILGLVWSLTLEPSHRLLDKAQQQVEENLAAFISLDQCTSRQQEINGVKREPSIRVDASTGVMRVAQIDNFEEGANLATDHMLRMAFRRRALAYDQSNLASYDAMETWTEKLFSSMLDAPPPGYASPSRDRIVAADRQMFSKIIEYCRSGVLPIVVGTKTVRPIEEALVFLAADPSVCFQLLPLPFGIISQARVAKPAMQAGADGEETVTRSKRKRENKKLRDQTASNEQHYQSASNSKGSAKGGGKAGKGKGRGKGGKGLPPALTGCWTTVKGQKACIWYNTGTCNNGVAAGESCRQGIHLCMTPNCGDLHPAVLCPQRLASAAQ